MGLFDFFKKKREPSIPHEALTLWVHRSTHFQQLAELMVQRGETPFQHWHLGTVFGAAPALRTTEGLIPLSAQHLEVLQMDAKAAFDRAAANSLKVVPSFEAKDGLLTWRGVTADVVVVLGATLPELPVKGIPVLMYPVEGLVLAAGADDPPALQRMLEQAEAAYSASGEFRSLRSVVYEERSGMPIDWFPEDEHPLFVPFNKAAMRSHLHELQGEHQVFSADAAPFAHHAIIEHDDDVSLLAAWARGSDVVVPWFADELVLLDTEDQPLSRLEVPFELYRDTFPAAVEALFPDEEDEEDDEAPEDAKLWRLRGALFPTAHERKYLLQRTAFVAQSPDIESREVPAAELLADFDGGATLLVAAAGAAHAGLAQLSSPDGRVAFVPPSTFGARVERLPLVDRARYFQSFFVQKMLSLMLGGADDGADDAELPVAPEGLVEAAAKSLPAVISSNDLRRMKSELVEKGDDLASQLVLTRLETWEPAHLFPVVRPPDYEQGAAANERGMVRGIAGGDVESVNPVKPLSRPGPQGLRLDLVSDRGNRMLIIDGSTMSDEMKESAWRTALLNLEAASLKPLKQESAGRYVGEWHDDYDFSRLLLLPRLVSACQVKGAPLVFAPTVGRTWVTGSDDLAGQKAVLDAIDAHFASGDATSPYQFRQMLFGWPWTVENGALVRWKVPAGHPLAARFETLDASLSRRRSESRKHVGQFAEQATRPSPEGREPQA